MYPNVHGVVGTISAITTYSITNDYFISGIVAFLSHDLMDRLGEKHYPSAKFLLLFEGILFAIFCFLAWKSDQTMLYAIGWLGGNMMDFIDKRMGLSIINPTKYPYLQLFPCHRRKPNYDFTLNQTIAVGILATFLLYLFNLN
jgi:hypothetical protein